MTNRQLLIDCRAKLHGLSWPSQATTDLIARIDNALAEQCTAAERTGRVAAWLGEPQDPMIDKRWMPVFPEGAPYRGIHTVDGETVAGTASGLSEAAANHICAMHNLEISEADDLIRQLGFEPSRFRTEAGWINYLKLKAAIRNPQDYAGLAATHPPHPQVPEPPSSLTGGRGKVTDEMAQKLAKMLRGLQRYEPNPSTNVNDPKMREGWGVTSRIGYVLVDQVEAVADQLAGGGK